MSECDGSATCTARVHTLGCFRFGPEPMSAPREEDVEALRDWNDLRFRNRNLGGRMSVPVALLADALGSLALATEHPCEKCAALSVGCGECETRRVVLERFVEWTK